MDDCGLLMANITGVVANITEIVDFETLFIQSEAFSLANITENVDSEAFYHLRL